MRYIVMLLIMFSIVAAGCSSEGEKEVDPELVELHLTYEPESIRVGETIQFRAAFTHLPLTEIAEVAYDFRVDDGPKVVKATREGDEFLGEFTFPEAGEKTIYLHIYEKELHIIKKAVVDVSE